MSGHPRHTIDISNLRCFGDLLLEPRKDDHPALKIACASDVELNLFYMEITSRVCRNQVPPSYVFGGGIMYKSEFKWVHDRINEVCMIKYPILSSFQTFLDAVRLMHAGIPEWVCVDDISAIE